MRAITIICLSGTIMTAVLSGSVPAQAAGPVVRGRFSFDAVATCQQPAVQNFAVHADGTGVLSTDRTATLDMETNVEGRIQYEAKLGAKKEAPGGSTSLRIAGRHTLKAIRDYPNNRIIVYMTIIGNSCAMRIENKLKPGKRQYTFYGQMGVAYCSRPRVTHTECTPY
jgi:hypothetical protein